uniref:thiopurine S-methyltransferase n=1 Tax=Nothoprocta perdicaria TaxID=30464 RepID=A0A8C6ZYA3_NOTPE
MDGTMAAPGSAEEAGVQQDRVVPAEEWLQKWAAGKTGFHKERGHPLLQKYLDVLVNGRSGLRIFFPLCGKAVEMKWLADLGHRVVGAEISERALREFFSKQGLPYREEAVPGVPGARLLQSTCGNISLYCCSIYDLSSAIIGKFDGVWDRGALVAVNPCDRQRSVILLWWSPPPLPFSLTRSPVRFPGPPFYVPEGEMRSLFGNQCEIKCLQTVDDFSDRHRDWGLDYFLEVLYILKFN